MTWKRLIIFSIICGVYTALVLLIPGVNETALREIGVGYECWFILAIFVVSNCKSTKDAAIKCFVFFLISQPLIYLLQMPFSDINLIAAYYKFWFIITLLTLPGGAIAYQITRNDLLGSIILSMAGLSVGFFGLSFILGGIFRDGFSYIIYGILLFIAAILLGFIFCDKKRDRVVYLIITIVASIVLTCILSTNDLTRQEYSKSLTDEDWEVSSGTFSKMDVAVNDDVLEITYYKKSAEGQFTLINKDGEEVSYSARIEDGELLLEEE